MGVKIREKNKGSGVWWIFINHDGKRKSKQIGKKPLALKIARKIEAKLTLGDFGFDEKNKVKTFGDYAKVWIGSVVPATCKRSTVSDYAGLLKHHLSPAFGDVPVDKIKKVSVKKFLYDKHLSGLSASTVNHLRSAMAGVLNIAVDDEAIPANPAHRLGRIVKTKPIKDGIEPLTRDELAMLLDAFKVHYPAHYPLALLLARTGMRIGEAIALKWGDIDFEGRFITVRRGISRGRVETPKNGKSRKVDMSQQLKINLLKYRHGCKLKSLRDGYGDLPEWLFLNNSRGLLDGNHWRKRIFNKALSKAELRKIRVHDLRHTYASLLIQNGESLAYVRDQLGHHSIKITVDIYGHLAPEGNKGAVDRLDDFNSTHPSAPYTHPGHEKDQPKRHNYLK